MPYLREKTLRALWERIVFTSSTETLYDTLMKSDEIFSFCKKDAALITLNQKDYVLLPVSVKVGHQVYTFLLPSNKIPNETNYDRKVVMKDTVFQRVWEKFSFCVTHRSK